MWVITKNVGERANHATKHDVQIRRGYPMTVGIYMCHLGDDPTQEAFVQIYCQYPMAVCDGRSIDVSKLIETDMIRGDYTGTMLYPRYNVNDTYRWYYMSGQDIEDVLLFKGFDTKDDGVKCRWLTRHLGFSLPLGAISTIPLRSGKSLRDTMA